MEKDLKKKTKKVVISIDKKEYSNEEIESYLNATGGRLIEFLESDIEGLSYEDSKDYLIFARLRTSER